MELLSNLVWIFVALALWSAWLAARVRPRSASLRSGVGEQLIALAVLSLVLLPVISVSDDLQASHNPAEVERTCIRSDQHLLLPDAPPPAPVDLALATSCPLLESSSHVVFLRSTALPCREETGHVSPLTPRPPPIARPSLSWLS